MNEDTAQNAISAALSGNWREAKKINKQILQKDPKDIDALNRLARAYAELGELKKARATATKVLKTDQFNTIALKALEKWRGLKKVESGDSHPLSPQTFLEEPGKTKIVSLLHLGASNVIVKLVSGDEVKLKLHAHRMSVVTKEGKYIGRLPDDLSAWLKKLIRFGNVYKVFIKSVQPKDVKIFVRETKRAAKIASIPSFSAERVDYIAFTPPELVHSKDQLDSLEEEEG